jgi:hypothetical protein
MAVTIFPLVTSANDDELDVEGFEIMPKLEPEEIEEINTKIKEI